MSSRVRHVLMAHFQHIYQGFLRAPGVPAASRAVRERFVINSAIAERGLVRRIFRGRRRHRSAIVPTQEVPAASTHVASEDPA